MNFYQQIADPQILLYLSGRRIYDAENNVIFENFFPQSKQSVSFFNFNEFLFYY